jgi:heat shock protein 90kDa beta
MKSLMTINYYRGEDYWQKPLEYKSKDFKLMVKRVFITSDIGDEGLPKWASWVKVVVDGMTTSNTFSFLCDQSLQLRIYH